MHEASAGLLFVIPGFCMILLILFRLYTCCNIASVYKHIAKGQKSASESGVRNPNASIDFYVYHGKELKFNTTHTILLILSCLPICGAIAAYLISVPAKIGDYYVIPTKQLKCASLKDIDTEEGNFYKFSYYYKVNYQALGHMT